MLHMILSLAVLLSAASATTTSNYESRSPLLQLYDGLYIQYNILQFGSFLPNTLKKDQDQMNFTLNLIRTVRQLELMQETPVSEGVKAVLQEVMEDSCRYIQELHSEENFTCTPTELDILYNKIEFMQDVFGALSLTYNMTPVDEPVLGNDYRCAFWNTRVLKNCTVSSPELSQVQEDIVEPKFGEQCSDSLCPIIETPTTEITEIPTIESSETPTTETTINESAVYSSGISD